MDISLSGQAFAFFAMVMCGAFCGVIFDVFRALRRLHKTASGVVALQDIIFWLLELFVVYMAAFRLNYAHIRAYEGIALIMGSWIYFMTVSSRILELFCRAMRYILTAVRFILRPVFKLTEALARICTSFGQNTILKMKHVLCKIKHKQKSKNIFTI